MFYRQEDVRAYEREQATDKAGTLLEYLSHLEHVSMLQAMDQSEPHQSIAEFNGTVLAGRRTEMGVKFVTWEWDFDHAGLHHSYYYEGNNMEAKQNLEVRSGRISKRKIFNNKQLVEIYRYCGDTMDADSDLTDAQEECIKSVREQLLSRDDNALTHIKEQEQHAVHIRS